MFEVIRCLFSLRNFLRQLRQDPDCGTTTLKIGMIRVGFSTQNKKVNVSLLRKTRKIL